jgi:superfamily II DNA or RNA helicase
VDEFHHYIAKTYRRALNHFKAKKLGLTATPDRGDGKAMGQLVDDVSYVMDILQGIEHGYLVPLEGKMATEVSVDVSDIGVTGGDLTASQLDEKIVKHVEGIVKETLRLYPDRRGPCFFPGVKSAELAAERFNALSPGSAAFIHGGTDPDERRMIIRAFKRGQYQWLCNCQIATEGFDDPTSNLIVLGRPTLSRALYAQMVGRGTRHLPGITDSFQGRDQGSMRRAAIASSDKPNCAILDFCGNSGKHDLMMPEDLLGGKYTDEERDKAKKIAREKGGGDALQNLEAARRELQRFATTVKSKVQSKIVQFDPFKVVDIEWDDQDRLAMEYGQKPVTTKQKNFLKRNAVPDKTLEGLSKRAASRLIDEIKRREASGLASYDQLRNLQLFGITERNISARQAHIGLSYIRSKGNKPAQVDPLKLWNLVHGSVSNAEDDGR